MRAGNSESSGGGRTGTILLRAAVPAALLTALVLAAAQASTPQARDQAGSGRQYEEQALRDLWINPVGLTACVPFLPETIPAVSNGVCDAQLEYPGDRCWDQDAWDALVGEQRELAVSIGTFTYFDFGNRTAPPLVLLPGLGTTKTQWDPAFLRDLAPWFRLIAPDYPGMGTASIDDYDDFTVQNLAAAVRELIDGLDLERPHLLGFAFSGKVAGLLFLQHPEELGKFVDVAGRIYNASGRTVSDERLAELTSLDPIDVALAAWPDNACGVANLIAVAEREISHAAEPRTEEALAAARRAQKAWQEEGDSLGLIGFPGEALIIAGDLDDVAPLEDMAAAAAVMTAGKLTFWSSRLHPDFRHYPWASHTVIYQYRPWVVREIVWFLHGPIGRKPAR